MGQQQWLLHVISAPVRVGAPARVWASAMEQSVGGQHKTAEIRRRNSRACVGSLKRMYAPAPGEEPVGVLHRTAESRRWNSMACVGSLHAPADRRRAGSHVFRVTCWRAWGCYDLPCIS